MVNKIVQAETAALQSSDHMMAKSFSLSVFLFQKEKQN